MTPFWKRKRRKPPKRERRDVWRELARRVGGSFVEGGRPSKDVVTVGHGRWSLKLDTYTVSTGEASVTYTRVRTFFHAASELDLLVRKRYAFFDTVLASLGFGGFTPGDRRLAARFVIKGKPETRLRGVVTAALGEALLLQPSGRLEVKRASRKVRRHRGADVRQVTFVTTGVVKDPARLEGMLDVVREALDAMDRVGVAGPDALAAASR